MYILRPYSATALTITQLGQTQTHGACVVVDVVADDFTLLLLAFFLLLFDTADAAAIEDTGR